MLPLSPQTCGAIGLAHPASAADLVAHLRISHDFLDGLITSEQAKQDAEQRFASRVHYELRVLPQRALKQERFCSVQLDGLPNPAMVGLLSNSPAVTLPTALENLLLWAIVDPTLPWHDKWARTGAGIVSDWRNVAAGQAVVAVPVHSPPEALRLICAMFGLQHADLGQAVYAPPLLRQAATVNVGAGYVEISALQARLLSEAGSVNHPKWRFLSLYRILENGYLANIKRVLLSEFDGDASKALQDASKKVSNEVNQLVALADEAQLQPEFDTLNTEIDALIAANNQFVIRLDRSASSEPLYGSQQTYKKGVLRFYKLRCAIAHAGTSSVIYEQFADADAAVTALLPRTELMALRLLKMA